MAQSNVSDTASSTLLLASNSERKGAAIWNDSTAVLYVLLSSGTASATVATAKIAGKEAEVGLKQAQAQATIGKAQMDAQMAPLQIETERMKLADAAASREHELIKMSHEREMMGQDAMGSQQEREFKLMAMQNKAQKDND